MHWLLIADIATDAAALALTSVALTLAYRTATIPIADDTFEDDMSRQSDCGSYAVLASLLAVALIAIGLIAI